MDRVRAVREERRHHRVEVGDGLGEHVEDRPEALALVVGLEPERLGLADVGVGLADQPHRLGGRRADPLPLQQSADGLEPAAHRGEQVLVDGLQRPGRRDLAELLVDHRRGPVDEVAPPGDELGVVALDERRPGELGVLALRAGRADEVPQRVRSVVAQHVAHVDDVAPGAGELLVTHGEELRRHHLGRQVQHAVLPGVPPLSPRPAYARSSAGQMREWKVMLSLPWK